MVFRRKQRLFSRLSSYLMISSAGFLHFHKSLIQSIFREQNLQTLLAIFDSHNLENQLSKKIEMMKNSVRTESKVNAKVQIIYEEFLIKKKKQNDERTLRFYEKFQELGDIKKRF